MNTTENQYINNRNDNEPTTANESTAAQPQLQEASKPNGNDLVKVKEDGRGRFKFEPDVDRNDNEPTTGNESTAVQPQLQEASKPNGNDLVKVEVDVRGRFKFEPDVEKAHSSDDESSHATPTNVTATATASENKLLLKNYTSPSEELEEEASNTSSSNQNSPVSILNNSNNNNKTTTEDDDNEEEEEYEYVSPFPGEKDEPDREQEEVVDEEVLERVRQYFYPNFVGVSIRRSRTNPPKVTFDASIAIRKKRTYLGKFESNAEAAKVYDDFAKRHAHGGDVKLGVEPRKLNFPTQAEYLETVSREREYVKYQHLVTNQTVNIQRPRKRPAPLFAVGGRKKTVPNETSTAAATTTTTTTTLSGRIVTPPEPKYVPSPIRVRRATPTSSRRSSSTTSTNRKRNRTSSSSRRTSSNAEEDEEDLERGNTKAMYSQNRQRRLRKRDGKEGRKKPAKSAYNLFWRDCVTQLKESTIEIPAEPGSVAKIVGKAWTDLPQSDKEYYEEEAYKVNCENGEFEDYQFETEEEEEEYEEEDEEAPSSLSRGYTPKRIGTRKVTATQKNNDDDDDDDDDDVEATVIKMKEEIDELKQSQEEIVETLNQIVEILNKKS